MESGRFAAYSIRRVEVLAAAGAVLPHSRSFDGGRTGEDPRCRSNGAAYSYATALLADPARRLPVFVCVRSPSNTRLKRRRIRRTCPAVLLAEGATDTVPLGTRAACAARLAPSTAG